MGVLAAGDTVGRGGRTLPLLLTSQHGYQGLRDSKTSRGASLVPSCVPCPRAVCSKTRLDFLAFCWSVLSEATQEAPASLWTITAPHLGSVPRAARAEFTPAPCVSCGPVSPTSGAEQRRGQRQPWLLALKYSPSLRAERLSWPTLGGWTLLNATLTPGPA